MEIDTGNTQSDNFRSAFVALIGRPNCGKSTLLNTILGQSIAIVTSLPQTTRTIMRGIYSSPGMQIVFLDTPGIHRGPHAINKSMYARSTSVLADTSIDVICYIVDLSRALGEEEDAIASMVAGAGARACIIFNKTDLCSDSRDEVNMFFMRYPQLGKLPHIAIAAINPSSKDTVLGLLDPFVKVGPRYFPDEDLTDVDMRFIAAEFIRKRIIESTREEVPHAVCVEILEYKEAPEKHTIKAEVHVESDGQKGIIIGAKGKVIARIQGQAGRDIAALAGVPVSVHCHVRVSPHWRDDPRFLKQLGLDIAGPKPSSADN